jgi:hypothetical protein
MEQAAKWKQIADERRVARKQKEENAKRAAEEEERARMAEEAEKKRKEIAEENEKKRMKKRKEMIEGERKSRKEERLREHEEKKRLQKAEEKKPTKKRPPPPPPPPPPPQQQQQQKQKKKVSFAEPISEPTPMQVALKLKRSSEHRNPETGYAMPMPVSLGHGESAKRLKRSYGEQELQLRREKDAMWHSIADERPAYVARKLRAEKAFRERQAAREPQEPMRVDPDLADRARKSAAAQRVLAKARRINAAAKKKAAAAAKKAAEASAKKKKWKDGITRAMETVLHRVRSKMPRTRSRSKNKLQWLALPPALAAAGRRKKPAGLAAAKRAKSKRAEAKLKMDEGE